MKRIFIKVSSILLALVLVFSFAGCKEDKGKKYSVYYLDDDKYELIEKKVSIKTEDTEEIANTLISYMEKKPKKGRKNVKPSEVATPTVTIDGIFADCKFDESYYKMSQTNEILYRAAVVKELIQIDGIRFVRFYVEDKEATYPDGTLIGAMSKETFADDSERAVGDVEWMTINCYYTNKAGDSLVKTKQRICFSKNMTKEKAIIETLISGPTESGCYQTIPSNVKLLSVSVVDKICYVNLSNDFLTELVNAKSQITIYSIVNTLCDLDEIDGVKLLINGDSSVMYRDTINLDTVFTKKDLKE